MPVPNLPTNLIAGQPHMALLQNEVNEAVNDHENRLDVVEGIHVNVKAAPYNAVGNGVANDTAAVAAAITAAGAGGVVYFPEGTYLTDLITLTTSHNGITLRGTGAGSVIKNRMTNATHLLWVKANDVTVQNLKLDGSRASQASNGGVTVSVGETPPGTQYRNFAMFGCWLTGNGFSPCSLNNVDGARIHGNYYSDNWDTCQDILDGSKNVSVIGNYMESVGRYGVSVDATSTACHSVTIAHNTIRMAASAIEGDTAILWGIVVLLAEGVTITGNTIEMLGGAPLGGIRVQDGGTRVAITGNLIRGVSGATDAGVSIDPVAGEANKRVLIQGNVISGFTGASIPAIRNTGGDKVSVIGNSISNCAWGINADKNSASITEYLVADNTVEATNTGIRFGGASNTGQAIASDNWAVGATTNWAFDAGWTVQYTGPVRANESINAAATIHERPSGYVTVASATTIAIPENAAVVNVTGTTTITSVTAKEAGYRVTLVFAGILTFTDGSNLLLSGNFVTTANDTITLVSDGTNWLETGRSVN